MSFHAAQAFGFGKMKRVATGGEDNATSWEDKRMRTEEGKRGRHEKNDPWDANAKCGRRPRVAPAWGLGGARSV